MLGPVVQMYPYTVVLSLYTCIVNPGTSLEFIRGLESKLILTNEITSNITLMKRID